MEEIFLFGDENEIKFTEKERSIIADKISSDKMI